MTARVRGTEANRVAFWLRYRSGWTGRAKDWLRLSIVPLVFVLAVLQARRPSLYLIAALVAGIVAPVLVREPWLGLAVLPAVGLLLPFRIGTGTDVSLTVPVLVVPALAALWVVSMASKHSVRFAPSRLNRPLLAFLAVTLVSLLRGWAFWAPMVPQAANLPLVQMGQISIYAVSFLAFWLMANLVPDLQCLRRVAYSILGLLGTAVVCLLLGRFLAIALPSGWEFVLANLSGLWIAGLALALASHDVQLGRLQRSALYLLAGATCAAAYWLNPAWLGGWLPLLVSAGLALWLAKPRLRLPIAVAAAVLLLSFGVASISQTLNLQTEWTESGAPRILLWQRALELGAQSPLLGLGPAAYRHYGWMKPLAAGTAFYVQANISAHNQFIDLFAQVGLLGLSCYVWFLAETAALSFRLWRQTTGFARGFGLAALCALPGIFLADMLAETSLPFVYNMGFNGLRFSVVSWLFFGGLVVLENMSRTERSVNVA